MENEFQKMAIKVSLSEKYDQLICCHALKDYLVHGLSKIRDNESKTTSRNIMIKTLSSN